MEVRPPVEAKVPGSRETRFTPWLLAILLLAAVVILANHRLISGRFTARWDADGYACPYYTLVADHARAMRFLLWNPWLDAGSPCFAEPQVGAFSPLTVGLGLLTGGHEWGFRVYWLTIWILGGLGIILLARQIQAPPWGGCIAALAFSFSGIYTGNAQHTTILYSTSFLPLIILRLDVSLTRRKLRPAVESGALLGLSALAGIPAMVGVHLGYVAMWVFGRLAFPEGQTGPGQSAGEKPSRGDRLLRFPDVVFAAAVFALVAGVAGVVMSPPYAGFFAEGSGYTTRVGRLAREVAIGDQAFHPGALATFASPYLANLQLRSGMRLWSYTDVTFCSIYLGSLLPILALLALVLRPRERWRWWLAIVALMCLGLAMGRALPFRGWLYDLCPPTRFTRHSAVFRIYFLFTMVVLGLYALRDIGTQYRCEDGAWKRLLWVSVFAGMVALLAYVATSKTYVAIVRTTTNPPSFGLTYYLGYAHAILIWLAPVLLAAVAVRYKDWRIRSRLPIAFVVLAVGDAALTMQINAPLLFRRYGTQWNDIEAKRSGSLNLAPRGMERDRYAAEGIYFNYNFPLKIPVLMGYSTFDYGDRNPFFRYWNEVSPLREMATSKERIFFSPDAPRVPRTMETFNQFLKRTEMLGRPPLVVHSRSDMLSLGSSSDTLAHGAQTSASIMQLAPAQPVPIDLQVYDPNELAFQVSCPSDGWLLVTDRWTRGWQAEIGGKKSDVWGGNYLFRAVRVQKGPNKVIFTYHPFGYPWLLIMSWGTMAAILFVSIRSAFRSRGRIALNQDRGRNQTRSGR